jgi:putative zinc finger/helix-turn-helix YgiT family protein
MRAICPHCEVERDLEQISISRDYEIRGEIISVKVNVLRCKECGKEFDPPDLYPDPLEIAYREYRRKNQMLQPEEIKELRISLGLTQKELAQLLGWGGATLSRYENGALQDDAHNTTLLLLRDPQNVLRLVESNPKAISPDKLSRLVINLSGMIEDGELSFRQIYERRFGRYPIDIYSGYRRLDLNKLFSSILYFCSNTEIVKTKLNKLLFFSDFKHFKEYAVSITGSRYAHLPYGPAPDRYSFYIAALHEDEGSLAIEEKYFNDYPGEVLIALKSPDLGLFSASEIQVLSEVNHLLAGHSAKALSDLSHREKGYLDTLDGELISYEYADHLHF